MGLGSGIRDPGSEIRDPGVKKAPDPGSRIRIRNTACHCQEPGVLPALPAGDGCPPQPLDPQPGEDSQPPSLELQLNIPGLPTQLNQRI